MFAQDLTRTNLRGRATRWRVNFTAMQERAPVRLIPSTYHNTPVLRGIVDATEKAEVLAVLEGKNNARLLAQKHGTPASIGASWPFARRDHDLRLYGQAPHQRGVRLYPNRRKSFQ